MFASLDPFEVACAVLAPATIGYLVLLLLVVQLSRSLERLLIVLGILTAVYAVWCGLASSQGAVGVQIRPGQAGFSLGGDAAGVLGRIAVLLILSGLAVIILNRSTRPAAPSSREEGIRVHPE